MKRLPALVMTAGLLLAQQPVFRVDVKLVRVLATVKDASGQPVGGLERGEFTVFDSGVKQDIAVFERHTEQPLSVTLLVDNSGSTGRELPYEIESVSRFLRAFFREGNPKDAISLYSFTHDVNLLSNFTRNQGRLEAPLKQLRADAGTSMYDAIWFGARALADREGRHVLILVTDGGDTTSAKNFQDALRAAHAADAVIYSILVVPVPNDPGRNVGGENALTTFSQSTGGRVFAPSVGPALDAAFQEILRDLRTQYMIGYYPKNLPPSTSKFREIKVQIQRPNLRVSTRSGYYGD